MVGIEIQGLEIAELFYYILIAVTIIYLITKNSKSWQ